MRSEELSFIEEMHRDLLQSCSRDLHAPMDGTKVQVVNKFCALSSYVRIEQFQSQIASDCFCPDIDKSEIRGFQFGGEIVDFINRSVEKRTSA